MILQPNCVTFSTIQLQSDPAGALRVSYSAYWKTAFAQRLMKGQGILLARTYRRVGFSKKCRGHKDCVASTLPNYFATLILYCL